MTTGSETPWKRLHPASVVVNLVPRTWRLVRSLWPLLLAMLYGQRASGEAMVDAGFLVVFAMLTFGNTILHWLTLRYRFHDGRLEIRTGLLNRQARVIAPERVQNTELVRNVFHRMSGLVEVRIETASGTEVEGQLSALSLADAQALVDALERGRGRAAEPEDDDAPAVVENSPMDLVRYGLTATRFGAAAVLIGVLLEGLGWIDPAGIAETWTQLGTTGVAALILGVVTGTWLVGTVGVVVRHYGFRLLARHDGLVAEEGLLTRRKVELPLRKVQIVTISEPWLRRLIGVGSVHIETAAAREEGGGTQRSEAVVPIVERHRLQEVVAVALPGLDLDLQATRLHPPHPRALIRAVGRGALRGLIFGGLLAWWWWPWGLLALVLVPISVLLAWLDHRHQGWLLTDQVLIARKGWLSRQTRIVGRDKLQSLEVEAGPVLRRYGLGELVVRVAGGAVALPIVGWDQALDLQARLIAGLKAAAPPVPPPPSEPGPPAPPVGQADPGPPTERDTPAAPAPEDPDDGDLPR